MVDVLVKSEGFYILYVCIDDKENVWLFVLLGVVNDEMMMEIVK